MAGSTPSSRTRNVPLLARIPLVPELVQASDEGDPTLAIESIPELARVYSEMATQVAAQIHLTPVAAKP